MVPELVALGFAACYQRDARRVMPCMTLFPVPSKTLWARLLPPSPPTQLLSASSSSHWLIVLNFTQIPQISQNFFWTQISLISLIAARSLFRRNFSVISEISVWHIIRVICAIRVRNSQILKFLILLSVWSVKSVFAISAFSAISAGLINNSLILASRW